MKFNYRVSILLSLVMLFTLSGCNPGDIKRNSRLEDSLLYYKIQMNRSNYTEAARFRSPDAPWDVRGLERFQLSHYEVKQSNAKDNGKTIERLVFLRYFDRHTMRERSTLYTEIWKYSDGGTWLLEGEPPVIR